MNFRTIQVITDFKREFRNLNRFAYFVQQGSNSGLNTNIGAYLRAATNGAMQATAWDGNSFWFGASPQAYRIM
jgi:hypothetical protein